MNSPCSYDVSVLLTGRPKQSDASDEADDP